MDLLLKPVLQGHSFIVDTPVPEAHALTNAASCSVFSLSADSLVTLLRETDSCNSYTILSQKRLPDVRKMFASLF